MAQPREGTVLVVDDDPLVLAVLQKLLVREGHAVVTAAGATAALAALGPDVHLVLTDVVMPVMDGAALLSEVLRRRPGLPVIVMTAHATIEGAVELMRLGAFDYLVKPVTAEGLLPRVERALRTRELERSLGRMRVHAAASGAADTILGESRVMQELVERLPQYATAGAPVLVTGESGTGKELVARALHDLSPRARRPFVPVNCGAIPDELFESELFGHVRGAFTDAHRDRAGLAEEAEGGTLFLDEVAELSLRAQVKLLRFLQTGEVRPVGGSGTRRVDTRIVSATHRDLLAQVQAGAFREDTYYRLGVLVVRIPPLRERREDVPLFTRRLLERFAREMGLPTPRLAVPSLEKLVAYDWPGNVRELENVLRRAIVLSDGPEIEASAIEVVRRAGANVAEPSEPAAPPSPSSPPRTLQEAKAHAIAEVERSFALRCLAEAEGNIALAARLAGKDRKSFWELLRKYAIDPEPFRQNRRS
jgi:DNA-binding NtrC family response regulator